MSFNQNDTNSAINLGNYEEFFILYMDGELGDEQVAMVDAFLLQHPGLQAELDMLMSTKLPADDVTFFNKEELFSGHMKLNMAGDELLLYIDNELPSESREALSRQLEANKSLQAQHALLLKTKLDASEHIPYPNKEELYRHTERVALFRPWMRVAAAAVVIAALGLLYWNNNGGNSGDQPPVVVKTTPEKKDQPSPIQPPMPEQSVNSLPSETIASTGDEGQMKKAVKDENRPVRNLMPVKQESPVQLPLVADKDVVAVIEPAVQRTTQAEDAADVFTSASGDAVNKSFVTSAPQERNTNIEALPAAMVPEGGEVASNKKGSIRGLLRKATRLVERTTGISATNEDDELLIGVVAVKLK
jgi:hypothetical protein